MLRGPLISPADFGVWSGRPTTHPGLLDGAAAEAIRRPWALASILDFSGEPVILATVQETLNTSHQLVIIARLSEYCQYGRILKYHESDPWNYMRRKLLELEEPLAAVKEGLLKSAKARLLQEMSQGAVLEERYAEYKTLFESLISRGDFADLAIHLNSGGDLKTRIEMVREMLTRVKPHHVFLEEKKSPAERSPSWEKLVSELSERLDLALLERVLNHKPRNAKRDSVVLRRLRSNVLEYCSVVRIPLSSSDTFTPFMLPRIEALIAANLRFIKRNRPI
ncbi:MAG: hypothetical protein HY549_10875 [Elusimicrobia bacterium]|nr:hypothetical protein [Elusimicrobiota bacterium]